MLRLEEELRLLDEEQQRCVTYYAKQVAAISSTITSTEQRLHALQQGGTAVPECSSFASLQPTDAAEAAQEVDYCRGLLILLHERKAQAIALLNSARSAFPASASCLPAVAAPSDVYECEEQDAAL